MLGYNVSKNGIFLFFINGRNKNTRKDALSKIRIGTHMGEWRRSLTLKPENITKTVFEYEYATTTGCYIRFQPATN